MIFIASDASRKNLASYIPAALIIHFAAYPTDTRAQPFSQWPWPHPRCRRKAGDNAAFLRNRDRGTHRPDTVNAVARSVRLCCRSSTNASYDSFKGNSTDNDEAISYHRRDATSPRAQRSRKGLMRMMGTAAKFKNGGAIKLAQLVLRIIRTARVPCAAVFPDDGVTYLPFLLPLELGPLAPRKNFFE